MPRIVDVLGRHPTHPFPARMAPSIALDALENEREPIRILDPMAGSGTVLALARARGHRAYGFDVDPLSVLLAKVWTSSIVPEALLKEAGKALRRAENRFSSLANSDAYPIGADTETREFVRYWFDIEARRQLALLALAIRKVRTPALRSALWCAFSRLIITKQAGASRAMDLSHSRPHRTYDVGPVRPFDKFVEAANFLAANCLARGDKNLGPVTRIRLGDAREIKLTPDSMDMVVTSPPYLNAIDYIRCSKFSLVWMGYRVSTLRNIRSNSIGAEVSATPSPSLQELNRIIDRITDSTHISTRWRLILLRYLADLSSTVGEISRVLRSEGKAVFVVGDSRMRGTYVKNSKALRIFGSKCGLKLIQETTRELPANRRYLPPPSAKGAGRSLKARMGEEVVLTFRAT